MAARLQALARLPREATQRFYEDNQQRRKGAWTWDVLDSRLGEGGEAAAATASTPAFAAPRVADTYIVSAAVAAVPGQAMHEGRAALAAASSSTGVASVAATAGGPPLRGAEAVAASSPLEAVVVAAAAPSDEEKEAEEEEEDPASSSPPPPAAELELELAAEPLAWSSIAAAAAAPPPPAHSPPHPRVVDDDVAQRAAPAKGAPCARELNAPPAAVPFAVATAATAAILQPAAPAAEEEEEAPPCEREEASSSRATTTTPAAPPLLRSPGGPASTRRGGARGPVAGPGGRRGPRLSEQRALGQPSANSWVPSAADSARTLEAAAAAAASLRPKEEVCRHLRRIRPSAVSAGCESVCPDCGEHFGFDGWVMEYSPLGRMPRSTPQGWINPVPRYRTSRYGEGPFGEDEQFRPDLFRSEDGAWLAQM